MCLTRIVSNANKRWGEEFSLAKHPQVGHRGEEIFTYLYITFMYPVKVRINLINPVMLFVFFFSFQGNRSESYHILCNADPR